MSGLIVINGKFMSQRVTGVQRYAREILLELDKLLSEPMCVEIAVNKDARDVPEYKNIAVRKIGRHTGNLWEQIDLPAYVIKNKGLCVSLCNMAPILTPHCVVIDDVSYKVKPEFFSWKFSAWYRMVFALSIRRIKKIITISEFSKKEIERCYRAARKDIQVVPCGWQHFERTAYAEGTLQKYGLKEREYYLALMSMAPNKNLPWILQTAKTHPEEVFVVCGGVNEKVFGGEYNFDSIPNLKLLGYVSDEEAKTLMRDCSAFIYPTFYEGFGIPPLEAMSAGAREIIVSDTEVMHEVYGEDATYIDPRDPDKPIWHIYDRPKDALTRYSWQKSAEGFLRVLKELS